MRKALKVFGGTVKRKGSDGRLSIADSSTSLNSKSDKSNSPRPSQDLSHTTEEEEEVIIEEVLSPDSTSMKTMISSPTLSTSTTICLTGNSSSSSTKIMSSSSSTADTKRSQYTHQFSNSRDSSDKVVFTAMEHENSQDGDEEGIVVEPDETMTVSISPNKTIRSNRTSSTHRMEAETLDQHHVNKISGDDVEMEGRTSVSAMKAKLEGENYRASKSAARRIDEEVVRAGDTVRSGRSITQGVSSTVVTPEMHAENTSFQSKKEQTIVSPGMRYKKNVSSSSSSRFFRSSTKSSHHSSTVMSSSSSMSHSRIEGSGIHGSLSNLLVEGFDGTPLPITHSSAELNNIGSFGSILSISGSGFKYQDDVSDHKALEAEYSKAEKKLINLVEKLKKGPRDEVVNVLPTIKDTLKKSWFLLGTELSCKLCDKFRTSGGLDIILDNIKAGSGGDEDNSENDDEELIKLSASVLQYSLSPQNVAYTLASNDSQKIVSLANSVQNSSSTASFIRAGIGIIANFFMSSEETCKELVKRGCLDTVISCCRSYDIETQRNCALALANLAMFGGSDVQCAMVKANVPEWLLVLGLSPDDFVRYNACHAIAALVCNKELEAVVSKTDAFTVLEQFVETHSPTEMSYNPHAKYYGQIREFLKKSVSLLEADKEDVKALGAFHFALTSIIKKRQGEVSILQKDLNVVPSLSRVASSPHALASKFAGQALKVLGFEIPHKLSQQVPCWSVDDVKEWVKQIGFEPFVLNFAASRVDGDLLLQLTEDMLQDDIGIKNGILRKRFMREVGHLKRITDYTSCDPTHLVAILENLGSHYLEYAYNLFICGVDKDSLKDVTDELLKNECKIDNSLHRQKILSVVRDIQETHERESREAKDDKSLDVFVSYRRSNGSQLASLLKVLLQMRGFSTFIDIERLESGMFDCNLVNSIRQAKHFILVLTPQALDRCIDDLECKDWVHREIVEALKCGCNIVPVVENFDWPDEKELPEDMRALCRFNSIRWIHEYQDACIDKLDRFLRGISTDLDTLSSTNSYSRNYGPPPASGLMSPTTPGTPSLTRK